MTALTANTSRGRRPGDIIEKVALAKTATVYQGSLLTIADGAVKAAVKASNLVVFGVALTHRTGGAKDGDVTVQVQRRGTFHFAKSGTAVVGKDAYIVDDNTVTDVSTGSSKVGLIIDSDSDGVWVELA